MGTSILPELKLNALGKKEKRKKKNTQAIWLQWETLARKTKQVV